MSPNRDALLTLVCAVVALVFLAPEEGVAQGLPIPEKAASNEKGALKNEKGWLGVSLKTVAEADAKVLGYDHPLVTIDSIFDNSPAHSSGLKATDCFLKLDEVEIKSVRQLVKTVTGHSPGDKIVLTMLRGKKTFTVPIILALRPDRITMMKDSYLNKPAPALEVKSPRDGKAMSLADHSGKVLLVDFWATWCGPCRRAMPHLNDLSKRHAKDGLVVIGVTDEEKATITEFMGKNSISYALGLDEGRKVHKDYMITALPTLFVIDHEGVVREIIIGGGKKQMGKLDATIERLLKDRNASKR